MATFGNYSPLTITAGQDLRDHLYKAVRVNGTLATGTADAIGVCMDKKNTGQHCTVGFGGIVKAHAGATINSGALLGVTSGGWLVPSNTSSSCIGRYTGTTAVASGALFEAMINFAGV